jgi:general secretion pathway protein I
LCHTPEVNISNKGFSLIEVLVALAIVAMVLAPISGLVAASVRGTLTIESHLSRLQTMRAIITDLPMRDKLAPGISTGKQAGLFWRIEVLPFSADSASSQATIKWIPQTVIATVQSPSGGAMNVSTVRLRRREDK